MGLAAIPACDAILASVATFQVWKSYYSLSALFENTTREERKQRLLDCLNKTNNEVDLGKRALFGTKDEIESARVKYENLSDLCATMEQLKCSLEEHIKTVRMNEGSFGGTSAVLEYDQAKTRTNVLINFIKARAQLDSAKEALAECGEDQQKVYESLVDMQQSYETLRQHIPNHGDDKALEQLKDRYLGWQSAALVFAIKQSDYEKLSEIQKSYEKLGRQEEFLGTFKRVSINCLKEYNLVTTNVPALITALRKEIEFVFTHHHKVLRRFMSEFASTELLAQAMKEGISLMNIETALASLVPEAENPIELLQKLEKVFKSEPSADNQALQEIMKSLDRYILEKLVQPFRSALTTYALSKVNSWEFSGSSFRTSVENFRVAITQLFSLFGDLISHTKEIFDEEKTKQIIEQPIEKVMENFMVKLRSWNYSVNSAGGPRAVDDLIEVCHTSGQFASQMEQFKESWTTEDDDRSLNIPIKAVTKWNRGVVEALVTSLRTKCTVATNEMAEKMQALKKPSTAQPSSKLPSFAHAPNEYVTNVGQEMLQLFHRLEEIFLDRHIVNAFVLAHKKKYDQEALLKKLLADISDRIMNDFATAVRPVDSLDPEVAKQFNADTVFLKDAFDDLRTGNTTILQELSDSLRKRFEKQ